MKAQNVGICAGCQAPLVSHQACTTCGFYKGKQVVDVSRNTARLVKRAQPAAPQAHDHADHDHGDHDQSKKQKNTKSKTKLLPATEEKAS